MDDTCKGRHLIYQRTSTHGNPLMDFVYRIRTALDLSGADPETFTLS